MLRCKGDLVQVAGRSFLFRIKHEENAKGDHQKRPNALENAPGGDGSVRKTLRNPDTCADGSVREMLHLDTMHGRHGVFTVHAGVMYVEEQHRGA